MQAASRLRADAKTCDIRLSAPNRSWKNLQAPASDCAEAEMVVRQLKDECNLDSIYAGVAQTMIGSCCCRRRCRRKAAVHTVLLLEFANTSR